MRAWATRPTTRHAVLHAFKLLHRVLIEPRTTTNRGRQAYQSIVLSSPQEIQYSFRGDHDPHRPWIVYYATLCIWSFVRAVASTSPAGGLSETRTYGRGITPYLSNVAALKELDAATAAHLGHGVMDLLETVRECSSLAHSELLHEAHGRLEQCRELLESRAPHQT
jgi:hypothetical protein